MRDSKRTRAIAPPVRARSYTAVKAEWEALIATWARRSFTRVPGFPARLAFIWSERTAHRDPDGIAAGGRKLILDGMVKAGVLPGDGAAVLCGFEDFFDVAPGNTEGVTVWFPALGVSQGTAFFPYRLPDLNELLALRELSARRSVKSSLRGRLA